eukprot:UN25550
MLEIASYLERYLWPNYKHTKSSDSHILSLIIMVNEKFRQSVPVWPLLSSAKAKFRNFLKHVLRLKCNNPQSLTNKENDVYVLFLINCLQSFENTEIRNFMTRVVNLPLWNAVSPFLRRNYLKELDPNIQKEWNKLSKKLKGTSVNETFMPTLFDDYFSTMEKIDTTKNDEEMKDLRNYCQRFLEFCH